MPQYRYTYGRQNWFPFSADEHRAVRETVGLFDQSSFAKFIVEGPDAEKVLNRISANDVAVPVGRIVYTQWLNERGGIEADLTVTREAGDRYLVVTSATSQTRDLAWLKRNIPEDARVGVHDVTSGQAVLGVMGPRARDLLQPLADADLSNEAFPFATSQVIDLGYARVRASRITYVGELGWELYIPSEFAQGVYDVISEAGGSLGLKLAGYHAMNSLRIEKGYRHWGHDIADEDSPLEAGLGFAVAMDKPGGFIGREALLRQKERGLTRRLVQFVMEDAETLLYHNEPILRDGEIVGRITSGMFGHTIGRAIGLGYVENCGEAVTAEFIQGGQFEIEVAGARLRAKASLKPLYDPENLRVKDVEGRTLKHVAQACTPLQLAPYLCGPSRRRESRQQAVLRSSGTASLWSDARSDNHGRPYRTETNRLPRSLYAETAREGVATPPLRGDKRVGVVVVGGGFTGLSTALHLAQRGGDVTVLEAREPGWGASGRNGGQVNPGLKHEPEEIERHFGRDLGRRMVSLSGGAPDRVFALVRELQIRCEANQGGTIRAAFSKGSAKFLRRATLAWKDRGAPVELLESEAIARATGTGPLPLRRA